MNRVSLLKICAVLVGFSMTSLCAMIRTSTEVQGNDQYGDDDGEGVTYYNQEIWLVPVWYGPGWYNGVWFGNQWEYNNWNYHHYHHRGDSGNHGCGGKHRGGGHR